MKFRPCIDLRNGKVTQIVGSTLKDLDPVSKKRNADDAELVADKNSAKKHTGTCRSCSNTGTDFMGKPCSCPLGTTTTKVSVACEILGVGNPLLDISANVPPEVMAKYGVKAGDIILAEEKHMGVYEELITKHAPVDYIAGGATQNSIRVASWMSKGYSPCAYMGCVGKDANAGILKERCEAAGVSALYMVDDATPTGKCACLITPDGERCLITDLQAANNYKKDHLMTPEAKALIDGAKIIYCAGFFLTSGGTDCTTLLGAACAAGTGKRFCLNLSAPFICEFFTAALDATMPYVDVVFGNETEAAALGKVKGWGDDIKTIALNVAKLPQAEGKGSRMVVFTQGASATIVAYEGVVSEYGVEPLARELLVDTNGAGDAFVGGFLSQLNQGADVAACCKAGNFAARHIIQRSGCTMKPGDCDYEEKADKGDGVSENFTSDKSSAYYAELYKKHNLTGGHVIMLGPGNVEAATSALQAYPGGMQVGGGVTPENAAKYLEAGASHVIVTSYVFKDGKIDFDRLEALKKVVGKERLVLDISCRKKPNDPSGEYYVVTDRWQKFSDFAVTKDSIKSLAEHCDEFLVHGVDVEGKKQGIEEELVALLGDATPIPTTYAGGVRSIEDLQKVRKLGKGKVDITVGSALDIFGGDMPFVEALKVCD